MCDTENYSSTANAKGQRCCTWRILHECLSTINSNDVQKLRQYRCDTVTNRRNAMIYSKIFHLIAFASINCGVGAIVLIISSTSTPLILLS